MIIVLFLRQCHGNAKSRHRHVESRGMTFPFQMLLHFLQEVLHSSVFSLVFKILYFDVQGEILLVVWLSWTNSPVRRKHGRFDSSVYLLLEVSSFAASALKRVKQKREGKGNSSIMKQRMYIRVYYSFWLQKLHKRNSYCHFPNKWLVLFCLFVSIYNRRGRYCTGRKTISCYFSVGKCCCSVSPHCLGMIFSQKCCVQTFQPT